MQRGWTSAAGAFALLAALAPMSAAAVNVTGTSAGISWSAASGPVAGYAIQVSRNGGSYREEGRITATATRVSGQIGETLRVRIAAYDVTGRIGTPSTPSDAITFVQAAPPPPPPPPPPAPPPPSPAPGAGDPAGDLDGDGMTDALAFNVKSGALSVLLVKSDGSREWQSVGTPSEPGMRPVGYADVDGDGQGDLFWRNAASGANELWRMNGTAHTVVALPDQPPAFRVEAFRDFSGDGRADAFFHDARTGTSEIWTLSGSGRSAVLPVDAAPTGMRLAAVADVDGDGQPDLVWLDPLTRAVEGWRMSGAAPAAVFSLPDAPARAMPAGAGDLDGDGDEDLVWHVLRKGARAVHAWFMDGMNAPDTGIAVRVGKKTAVRGVLDVDSDGRADLVLVAKGGFKAYRVDATGTQNAGGGAMEWNTQVLRLREVPASKRWYFLVLE